jgi:hypothetical protein
MVDLLGQRRTETKPTRRLAVDPTVEIGPTLNESGIAVDRIAAPGAAETEIGPEANRHPTKGIGITIMELVMLTKVAAHEAVEINRPRSDHLQNHQHDPEEGAEEEAAAAAEVVVAVEGDDDQASYQEPTASRSRKSPWNNESECACEH